jgi:MFS superfamily sulfate permease-like transporter
VALPLCLGIALACGAPLYAGVLSGIIGGVFVSLISGSQLSVSGPAAGLTPVVAASIISLGDFRIFLLAVIVAGLVQLILGLLKLGVIAHYFPSAVIKGMLAAIGIILISKQIPIALGYDQPDFWTSGFPQLFSDQHFFGNVDNFALHTGRGAVITTCLSIGILILFQKTAIGSRLKLIPAPLVVVLVAALLAYLFNAYVPFVKLKPSQMVHIPLNIFGEIKFPQFNELLRNPQIWTDGVIIGLLASLETLLCIEAVDKLDPHNRVTPVNRELIAQGIGNMVCGLLGAIPMTAVIVRGAANAQAGARTWMSSFTHGLFLLMAVTLVPFLLNYIPFTALAAILLVTGYNLNKPRMYSTMWKLGWKQFAPFIITIITILSTDLLIGVCIGLLISVYFVVLNNFKEEYETKKVLQHETEVYTIRLNNNVTFLNKVKLKRLLDKIPEYSIVTIDGTDCHFIDYDNLEIISAFESKAHDKHIEVHLLNIERVNITSLH